MKPLRFGIIGVGAMGYSIAMSFYRGEIEGRLSAIYDIDAGACRKLLGDMDSDIKVADNIGSLVDSCDIVIECASQAAVKEYVPYALSKGRGVLIMSYGALLDDEIRKKILAWSKKTSAPVYMPSGAVSGIDGLLSAMGGHIQELTLTTTKNPINLGGVKYIKDCGIDLSSIKKPTTVFEGKASDAARHFPKNINIAAVVSFAADKQADVKIIADPAAKNNQHRIVASGDFGRIICETENVPSPQNPKTSYLAILSAIATLKKITGNFKIGN